MQKVKQLTTQIGIKTMEAGLFFMGVLAPARVMAQVCDPETGSIQSGAECARPDDSASSLFGDGGIFQTVANVLIFLVGAISVIMLIIGGLRYVVSGGSQDQVTSAKNTIIYAIIGIVVAFVAFAAVNFVIDRLQSST